MCPPVLPPPSITAATPLQHPCAWLLLVGAACALGVLTLLLLRDFAAGAQRILASALLTTGAVCVLVGTFLLTNVSVAWSDAVASWYASQSAAMVARGCALAPVDTANAAALAALGRISAIGTVLLVGSGFFYIGVGLLRSRWRRI